MLQIRKIWGNRISATFAAENGPLPQASKSVSISSLECLNALESAFGGHLDESVQSPLAQAVFLVQNEPYHENGTDS